MQQEEKIDILIVKLFSESITKSEKNELDEWMYASKENLRRYQELKNLWQITHLPFSHDDIDTVDAEIKIMEEISIKKNIIPNFILWWQRVAAILILPIMAFAVYLMYNRVGGNSNDEISYQEIQSPFGVSSKINLPDGSLVWLNSGSTLKYPVVFNTDERRIFLSGEAYFKVQSDKIHPFIVSTTNVNVRATGTQFNVDTYSDDSLTSVTLMEGSVAVYLKGLGSIQMTPNQRLVLNSNSKTYKMVNTNASIWGTWKDGVLAFKDQPLSEVFKRISRTFNVDIQVKNSVVGNQLYKATFEDESLDEILRLLKMSTSIRYKRIKRMKQLNNGYGKELIEVY